MDTATNVEAATASLSVPGALHYLYNEWRHFERDRSEWELERAELKVNFCDFLTKDLLYLTLQFCIISPVKKQLS
jgi:hypothetical protein